MANDYHFWETMLADPSQLGKTIFANEEEPQPGFYRTKDGKPVAIWFQPEQGGDVLVMIEGDRMVAPDARGMLWTRCLSRPVTEEAYNAVRDGGIWPDVDAVVADTIGANIKDANDPETIGEMIDALAKGATEYFDRLLADEEEAAKAQSLRARLNELGGKADGLRETEKKPHWDAGKAVDAKWQPMVKKAADIGQRLRLTLSRYEDWKRQQEAKRQQAEAERRQQEAEAARAGQEPPADQRTPAADPAPAPAAQIRGGYGRAASVRTVQKVTAIDIDVVFSLYRNHAEVHALLMKLAQADVARNLAVPGATIETVSDVR